MRSSTFLTGILLLCFGTVAFAAPDPAARAAAKAARKPSAEALMRVARGAVLQDIKLHGSFSSKLAAPTVTSVVLGSHSDGKTLRGITGYGTIHVTVKQGLGAKSSLLQRLGHPFNKYTVREFDVAVDAAGHSEVLNPGGWSQTGPARFGRWFRNGPGRLVASFLKDNPNSKKILTGAAIAIGTAAIGFGTGGIGAGLLAAKLSLGALFTSGVAVTKTVGYISDAHDDVAKLKAARTDAFNNTVTWAEDQGKSGPSPTLVQAYEHYNSLRPDQRVVRNYTLGGFAEALQSRGL